MTLYDFNKEEEREILNYWHPNYSAKLAAAITVWEFLKDNPDEYEKRSPKSAAKKWLTENAKKFGLTNKDGKISKKAIEEIATVVNWQPQGGAPKSNTDEGLIPPF